MAGPPKKPAAPAVRGRPQGTPGTGRGAAPSADTRTVSLEAGRALQRALDAAPAAAVGAKAKAKAPEGADETTNLAQRALAAAAEIELTIHAGPIEASVVERRLQELRRLISMTTPVLNGERVALGDEVELDLLGYINGQVFMAHQAEWFELKANAFLPGLFEALVNMAPPDNAVLQLRLPEHYPVPEVAGKVAAFAVTVRQARRRTLPEADDPIFIQLTSRKVKTLDELKAKLAEELSEERARLCVDEAKMALLRQLYIRVGVDDDVPEDLVDEDVRRRWKARMGDAMAHQGIPLEEQKKSLAEFSLPAVRAEARRSVWEQRCLEAVVDAMDITVADGEVQKLIADLAPDIRRSDVDNIIFQQAALTKDIGKGFKLHRALLALLGKAKVTFDPTPAAIDRVILPALPIPGQATSGASGPTGATSGKTAGSGGSKAAGDLTAARGLKRR